MSNTTQTTDEIYAEIVADCRARIGELEELVERQRGILTDTGWVVVSAHGFPIKFTINPDGSVPSAQSTNVENATRLSRDNARHLAAAVKDGTGGSGKAMPYIHAIHDAISDQHALLEQVLIQQERRAQAAA